MIRLIFNLVDLVGKKIKDNCAAEIFYYWIFFLLCMPHIIYKLLIYDESRHQRIFKIWEN